jgi:radical SAM superfamily enzyme YgiQ (UPF0313 family)
LLIGFESINAENLRHSSKPFNRPQHFAEVVTRLHAHGIAVYGCFVFGMDQDTPEVFLETARFAVEAGIDLPRFAIVTPFPGTALHERRARRAHPDQELGALRRPARRLPARAT